MLLSSHRRSIDRLSQPRSYKTFMRAIVISFLIGSASSRPAMLTVDRETSHGELAFAPRNDAYFILVVG